MAAKATKKQQQPTASAVVDPKFEWAEKTGSYVLRLALPGFRKDEFRVQVEGAGRLTVRGSRPAASGQGSLNKVFQLPLDTNRDDITGRFEAGVLALTVPKHVSATAGAAPTSIEEIKRKPSVAKEEGATAGGVKKVDSGAKNTADAKEEITKEDALKRSMEEATNKAREKKQQGEDKEAKSRKEEQQKAAPAPAVNKEEAAKPSAPLQATATPAPQKPDATASTDKAKAVVAPESLAERVRRRGEEERAKAAAAAAKDAAKAGQEKQATPCCSWKERVQGELKELTSMKWVEGLTDMKWADGVVEAARKNKEVVAVGIAAFSLGFFVSQKLFRK